MQTLQQATEKICELYGSVLNQRAITDALIQVLPHDAVRLLLASYQQNIEDLKAELLPAQISEHVIDAIERESRATSAILTQRLIS